MDENEALRVLDEAGARIVAGVRDALPAWVEARALRLVDAWGRHEDDERAALAARLREAGDAATARVVAELEALFAADPAAQRSTPAQIVRSAYREPSELLAGEGMPLVERDAFDERALPEDGYDLAPPTLADLGGEPLNDALLAWGAAKAALHLVRRREGSGGGA